jgi:hypothetical protein
VHRYALTALALAGALLAFTATVSAAPARAEPAQPKPEELWRAYPLNPTAPPSCARRAGTPPHPGPATTSQGSANKERDSGSSAWWLLALALGGGLVVVLIAAIIVLTRLQPSVRWPSRRRLRAAVAPARGGVEALAAAASRRARGVAGAVQHVPTVVAERRPRLPHLSRPTLPRIPVPAAMALTEPLLESVRAHVRRPPEREAEPVRGPATQPSTHREASDTSEAEILKRKGVTAKADETAMLKQKSRAPNLPRSDRQHGAEVLKAKLASRAESAPEPAREPEPVRAPVELRPVRAVGSAAPAAEPLRPMPTPQGLRAAPRPAEPVCRIEWWRGYRKSHFDARVLTEEGDEAVLVTSPPFRWSKATPPSQHLQEVTRAHEVLLEQLEAGGWVVTGGGKDWYALELRRPPSKLIDPAK